MVIALLLALQIAPAAQPTPAQPTVVVTGRRDTPAEVRRAARAITPVGDLSHPLARFQQPVCPWADGITPEATRALAARIRADAAAAHIPVAKEGCEPNALVIFVPNGQMVVRTLAKEAAGLLGDLPLDQVRALTADAGPVHQWSYTELRSRDGDREKIGTVVGKEAPQLEVRDASIIHLPTRLDLTGAILLIDQPAAIGKTLGQIGDYAAMRLLAQTRPRATTAIDTILTLFDTDATPPRALTAFDRGYLGSLYRGPATQSPLIQVQSIARDISKGR